MTEPLQRDVPVSIELVGQAVGFQDVEIRARVEGFLQRMAFTEGSLVKKGDLLCQIDPKPLQAAVANAKANLAMWQARLEKGNNDVKRLTPLAAQQAVSQQEVDNAVAQKDAASAQVDAQKAPSRRRSSISVIRPSPRPLTASSERPMSRRATWSAAAKARCWRPFRRSTPSSSASGLPRPSTSKSPGVRRSRSSAGRPGRSPSDVSGSRPFLRQLQLVAAVQLYRPSAGVGPAPS